MLILRYKVNSNKVKLLTMNEQEFIRSIAPILITGLILLIPCDVLAASAKDKVDKAVQPIIDTIKAASKPICYGSALWGWSKMMLGQKKEGYSQIKNAAWGYIGVQLTPWLFGIIQDIGSGVN